MIDSGIWLNGNRHPGAEARARGHGSWASVRGASLAGLLSILISACGSDVPNTVAPNTVTPNLKPPRIEDAVSELPSRSPDRIAPPSSFVPLPSLEQVLSAVPDGRPDPFAPVAVAAPVTLSEPSGSAPEQTPVLGLQVQGVLSVGGERRALVATAEGSGSVCLGQRGRCPGDRTALLPPGWVVQAIDLRRGCLTVAVAGQSESLFCIT